MVEASVFAGASLFTGKPVEKHSCAITFAAMSMFAIGDKVKINTAVLEDQTVKSNHHLFEEALKHNVTGEIVESDTQRTSGNAYWFRVKFHFFTAPLKEDHLVLLSKV